MVSTRYINCIYIININQIIKWAFFKKQSWTWNMERKQPNWLHHLWLNFPLARCFLFRFQVVRINGEPRTSESAGFKLRDHLEIGHAPQGLGENGEPLRTRGPGGNDPIWSEHIFPTGLKPSHKWSSVEVVVNFFPVFFFFSFLICE